MNSDDSGQKRDALFWRVRIAMVVFVTIAVAVVWVTNQLLTERFIESTRSRAEVRLASYSGNLRSELQRASIVPLLLARDPVLIAALGSGDFSQTTQRLISLREEIGAAGLTLLDQDGRVVAATDRAALGAQKATRPYFVQALRSSDTVFTTNDTEAGGTQFTYSRRIAADGRALHGQAGRLSRSISASLSAPGPALRMQLWSSTARAW